MAAAVPFFGFLERGVDADFSVSEPVNFVADSDKGANKSFVLDASTFDVATVGVDSGEDWAAAVAIFQ